MSYEQLRAQLDRLDAATYGACERCGEDIGLPRLQVGTAGESLSEVRRIESVSIA